MTRSAEIVVTRNIAAPSGPNTAAGTISASGVTGSTPTPISGTLTIEVGASGTVYLNATYSFTVSANASSSAYARWYKWNGSVWSAIGTETEAASGAQGTIEPGDGACSESDAGNTADSIQQYRLFGRPSIGGRSINFSGNVSAASA